MRRLVIRRRWSPLAQSVAAVVITGVVTVALVLALDLSKEVVGALIAVFGALVGTLVGAGTTLQIEHERREAERAAEEQRRVAEREAEHDRREAAAAADREVARGIARVLQERFRSVALTLEGGRWPRRHELELEITEADRRLVAAKLVSWLPVARGEEHLRRLAAELATRPDDGGSMSEADKEHRLDAKMFAFAAQTLDGLAQSEPSYRAEQLRLEEAVAQLLATAPATPRSPA